MSILSEDTPILSKTRELCTTILESELYAGLQARVERFLDDEKACAQYRNVQELGDRLHQKQHAGMQLSDDEIQDFEIAHGGLLSNEVAVDFLQARETLANIRQEVSKHIALTLELGHIPTEEDLAEGGCCSSGGGCSCGGH